MPRRRASSPTVISIALAALWTAGATAARAQTAEPVGKFVADVHGVLARYDQPNHVAAQLGVAGTSLPGTGPGVGFGAHVYPLRWRNITVGMGVSGVWSRGRQTPTDPDGEATGPTVETTLAALAPQASLNFGTRNGWSYISGGVGPATYTMRLAASPTASSVPRVRAINFGAGARWFAKQHVAFSFDLRWYALDAQAATAETPERSRTTRMVFSAGISVK